MDFAQLDARLRELKWKTRDASQRAREFVSHIGANIRGLKKTRDEGDRAALIAAMERNMFDLEREMKSAQ
jgi:hypothetical protein